VRHHCPNPHPWSREGLHPAGVSLNPSVSGIRRREGPLCNIWKRIRSIKVIIEY
jgi:hypothetical protein